MEMPGCWISKKNGTTAEVIYRPLVKPTQITCAENYRTKDKRYLVLVGVHMISTLSLKREKALRLAVCPTRLLHIFGPFPFRIKMFIFAIYIGTL